MGIREEKKIAEIALPTEVRAFIDGDRRLQLALLGAIGLGEVSKEEIACFVRSTPDGKKGSALWKEFAFRQHTKGELYGFPEFIREINQEAHKRALN